MWLISNSFWWDFATAFEIIKKIKLHFVNINQGIQSTSYLILYPLGKKKKKKGIQLSSILCQKTFTHI